ncbi:MAG: FAD-dependent oxidoreductase [Pseudomonadota bacterium]|nr:FAD-dependent oxidoreductase [Pseudomonadota bacterium]
MSAPYDAVVIGAGVIGAAVGFELSKKGWKTLNVDKLSGAGYGSTAASCAIIRVHYSTLDGCAMAYEGYHYWKDWSNYLGIDDTLLAQFIECGCMVYLTEQNRFLETVLARADELDIPYQRWTPAEVERRLPITRTSRFGPVKLPDDPDFAQPTGSDSLSAVYFPTAGYINDPQLSARNLQRAAESRGGRFLFGQGVVEILKVDGRAAGVLLSDGSKVESKVVINVAGPHSMKINALAGVVEEMNIHNRALKVEVAHVPPPPGFDYEHDGFVVSDSDIGCYSRPETGNHILIGSEDPDCDERIFVDPDAWDENFSDQWRAQVYRQAQRYPDLPVSSPLRGVVSMYDVSDDWLPVYDQSSLPGFYMACGTSGNQYKNAPVAGKLMAELVEYCESGNDHDRYPMPFLLDHIGFVLNTATVSRLRPINPESSFSVLG